MVLTNFTGAGVGFGFGFGCGFGVGWGFGGMPLNFLGLGAGIMLTISCFLLFLETLFSTLIENWHLSPSRTVHRKLRLKKNAHFT